MQQCRHCTLRTYVSRTSIIVLCWIRSIDCIGQDQLESSHSTFWIRFWIAQLDHDWIPRLIYDGHQLVSLLYSPHLFEGSWSLIWYQRFTHFLKTHPWLVLKRKNIKSLEKTFFQTSKVLRILKMLKIILKIHKKLWTFEFSLQFVWNDMLLRKIKQPLKKV